MSDDTEGKRVLVIDDEEAICKLVARALTDKGYRVTPAGSSEEAEPFYREAPFDLVVCDYKLPGVDGIETVRRIKEIFPDTGSVLITGVGGQETIIDAFTKGGVDYYLTKPFGLAELTATAALADKAGAVRKRERLFAEEMRRQVEKATAELQEKNLLLKTDKKAIEELNRQLLDDKEKLQSLNEQLQRLAVTDELTGLANHRFFIERLEDEVERVKRNKGPLSLLMIDLDNFKKINDTYGHLMGDAVLRSVAKVMGGVGRAIDLAARYGGEEFSLILPGVTTAGATVMAERLRKEVDAMRVEEDNKSVTITLSVGVAQYNMEAMHSIHDLLRAADAALYVSKKEGKNRVTVHQWSS